MTMAKKKTTKTPEGITFKRTPKGINVTVSTNGRILSILRGYNNTANMQKGLEALYQALGIRREPMSKRYDVVDLTAKAKKK